jgi:hypothetical protein
MEQLPKDAKGVKKEKGFYSGNPLRSWRLCGEVSLPGIHG